MSEFDELLDGLEEGKPWVTLLRQSYQEAVAENYVQSIELAEEALKLNPKSGEAYRLIGNAYEFLGDEKEIKGDSAKARELHNQATESWNKAMEINPNIIIPGYHGYE